MVVQLSREEVSYLVGSLMVFGPGLLLLELGMTRGAMIWGIFIALAALLPGNSNNPTFPRRLFDAWLTLALPLLKGPAPDRN